VSALARNYVGQGNACGQHFHPHFTSVRLGALLFNQLKCVGPAVVSDDDSRVSHEMATPRGWAWIMCEARHYVSDLAHNQSSE